MGISVIQDKDEYIIQMKYDPVAIQLVKLCPGRRWNPERKIWTIPKDKLGFLINQFKGTKYEDILEIQSDEDIGKNATIDSTPEVVIPDVDLSNINMYVKDNGNMYSHQQDFMKFAIDKENHKDFNGFLLADEQGTGKTLMTINLAMYNKEHYKCKHCLIICCINSSKWNWKNEIEDHTNGAEEGYILGTRISRTGKVSYGGSTEKFEDLCTLKKYGDKNGENLPYFLIMNIEALRYKVKKSYPIQDAIIALIEKGHINIIAIDEIHKNASMTSMQGKCLFDIKKKTSRQVLWLPMTGTPIVNKPTDVFLPLRLVEGHKINSYYSWCKQFCIYGGFGGHEIIGYKNMPMLKEMLQSHMLRRLKKDVLDLPEKIEITEYVENTPYQEKLYKKVVNDLLSEEDTIITSPNPMAKFLRLRQVNGSPELVDTDLNPHDIKDIISKNAKLARLLELLEDIKDKDEKTLIFSNWVSPLDTLEIVLKSKGYNLVRFDGTMSGTDREASKAKFQNDSNCTILLGTVGSAGTSHTFTAATNVIFYDEPWTPADKAQASDRAYRIGTKTNVNIITLITKDTVDDKVHDILYRKSGISQFLVDNALDLRNNPELFSLLLGRSK